MLRSASAPVEPSGDRRLVQNREEHAVDARKPLPAGRASGGLRDVLATRYVTAAARGRVAARTRRGRRRRALRDQVPRRRAGAARAGGRGDHRRAGPGGRAAGPRAGTPSRSTPRLGRGRARSGDPGPDRRQRGERTSASTSCRARWPTPPPRPGSRRPELAADIVWLDALATNVDRTARNPNLLLWHERLWLIDHGAALYLQHGGLDPARARDRPFPLIAEHVLLPTRRLVLTPTAACAVASVARRGERSGRGGPAGLVLRRRPARDLRRLPDRPPGRAASSRRRPNVPEREASPVSPIIPFTY